MAKDRSQCCDWCLARGQTPDTALTRWGWDSGSRNHFTPSRDACTAVLFFLQEAQNKMWQSCSVISSCDCHAACRLHLFMCWTHLIWLQMKGQWARAHVCRQWCMYIPNSVQKKQSPPRPLYLFQQFLLNAYFMLARHVEGHSKMLFMRQMGNIPNVQWEGSYTAFITRNNRKLLRCTWIV